MSSSWRHLLKPMWALFSWDNIGPQHFSDWDVSEWHFSQLIVTIYIFLYTCGLLTSCLTKLCFSEMLEKSRKLCFLPSVPSISGLESTYSYFCKVLLALFVMIVKNTNLATIRYPGTRTRILKRKTNCKFSFELNWLTFPEEGGCIALR